MGGWGQHRPIYPLFIHFSFFEKKLKLKALDIFFNFWLGLTTKGHISCTDKFGSVHTVHHVVADARKRSTVGVPSIGS